MSDAMSIHKKLKSAKNLLEKAVKELKEFEVYDDDDLYNKGQDIGLIEIAISCINRASSE